MSVTGVVTAGIPEIDDCPIFGRLNVFAVRQGVCETLQHVFRNPDGSPIDLSAVDRSCEDVEISEESAGSAESPAPRTYNIKVRIKEAVSNAGARNPLNEVEADVFIASEGVVQARPPVSMIPDAGIYNLSWGVLDEMDKPILVDETLLAVERSLWTQNPTDTYHTQGPPTLKEIRMALMDSSAAENILLDRVEFDTDQIIYSICHPVEYWNEVPPPVARRDTRNFDWKDHWQHAIVGHLLEIAAHNYRRNHLPYGAGGLSIDDKNKEQEYFRAGKEMLDEWQKWVLRKKVEINARMMVGSIGSSY